MVIFNRANCTKRTAVRPGFETTSQQHAAHAQQRCYSIHAVFLEYAKIDVFRSLLFFISVNLTHISGDKYEGYVNRSD